MGIRGFIVTITLIPVAATALIVARSTTSYIPSQLIEDAARQSTGIAAAQSSIQDVLIGCKGNTGKSASEFGTRYRKFYSWRNDAGWFAVTHVDCDNGLCRVSASALIAAPRRGERCGLMPLVRPAT